MKDDAVMRKIRARHNDIPQDALFDMANASTAEPTKKAAKPKTVDHVTCPECKAEKVGVIQKTGEGFRRIFVLRDHDRVTWRGHRFRCPASGTEV